MGVRPFKSMRPKTRKVQLPSKAAVMRAARAILYPEAGDPLPTPGSLLEQEAQKFVAFIGTRNANANPRTRHRVSAH